MDTEAVNYNNDMNNNDIKKYAQNSHRMSFMLDPVNLEMYIDYGNKVTEEEMIEAAAQIALNILDHIPAERKKEAASEIVSEIRQYVIEKTAQA